MNYPQKRSQPGKQKYPYHFREVDSPYILVFQHDDTNSSQNCYEDCEEIDGNFYLLKSYTLLDESVTFLEFLNIAYAYRTVFANFYWDT